MTARYCDWRTTTDRTGTYYSTQCGTWFTRRFVRCPCCMQPVRYVHAASYPEKSKESLNDVYHT